MVFQQAKGGEYSAHLDATPTEHPVASGSILDVGFAAPQMLAQTHALTSSQPSTDIESRSFVRAPMDFLIRWPDTIFDSLFQLDGLACHIKPVSAVGRFRSVDGWFLLQASVVGEPACIALELGFFRTLLESGDFNLSHLPQNVTDRALVVECLFEPAIERLQNAVGGPIEIRDVIQCSVLPQFAWLTLEARIGELCGDVGIAFGPKVLDHLTNLVERFALPNEREVGDTLLVKIGPITLPYFDSKRITTGDVVDTGINPSGEVYGILERSDRRYWPILIDDDAITIIDHLQQPAATQVGKGSIISTLQIGWIEMSAPQRIHIKKADRLSMHRIEDNGAKLFLGHRLHGSGSLDVNEGNLVISVETVGAVN